jgi:hypothetical protein
LVTERKNVQGSEIPISELAKIPFIDVKNLGARVLTTLTFFEDEKWQIWLPTPQGLINISGIPAEADYFARTPVTNTDINQKFLDFIVQRASWADTIHFIYAIRSDIHNLGASLAKLSFFHRAVENAGGRSSRFVSTELEYIFGVCRSIFDLLQEIITKLWQRISLHDSSITKRELPQSFAKMALSDNKVMEVAQLQQKWRVPEKLASFYIRHANFFKVLRDYRDAILHCGADFDIIFVTEKGFAVRADTEPFASFGVWNEEHMLKNRLASLRPIIAYVITKTFNACDDFAGIISEIIRWPPEIVPGFKLYVRGFHNTELIILNDVLENCSWWD